jgi:hypothetical protein
VRRKDLCVLPRVDVRVDLVLDEVAQVAADLFVLVGELHRAF